ncbi:MAG: ABC transporter permease [Myxococcales bacterium]|nr:ABC transporter permease [Myxococcales bacterium]
MKSVVGAVARVEWLSAVRDRRALLSALVFPLVGPVMIGFMFTGLARTMGSGEAPALTIRGGEHAPQLMSWLRGRGLQLHAAPTDADAQVRDGRLDVLIVIKPDFPGDFVAGEPAEIEVIADYARTSSAADVRRAQQLLRAYSGSVASFRLLARGIHPNVISPIKLSEVDLATPQKHSANLLTVVPLFVILACFIGGMQVAIDSTAGERERGSLEALLLNPVPRGQLALGKWLVTTGFSATSAVITLLLSVLSLRLAPLEELGVRGDLGVLQVVLIAMVVLPLAPLASAAQLYVATFARSFKEAQTWLSVLLFLPMIPGVIATIMPIRPSTWMFAVPALSQQLLITDALRGEFPSSAMVVIAAVSSFACAGVGVWATGRMLSRERIIFAGQ